MFPLASLTITITDFNAVLIATIIDIYDSSRRSKESSGSEANIQQRLCCLLCVKM